MNENFYNISRKHFNDIKEPHKELRSDIRFAAFVFLLVFFFFILIPNFFYEVVDIKGASMNPTIYNSDKVGVLKVGNFKRGDIVVFYSHDLEEFVIKRVIGLAGDTIWLEFDNNAQDFKINRSRVVNGEVESEILDEPYILEKMSGYITTPEKKFIVPNGYIFVLGDNRNNSEDSFDFGFVAKSDVLGKAITRLYKTKSFKVLGIEINWFKTKFI